HTPFVKKLARLRSKPIYEPVVILHPVLPVTQNPVVQTHQLRAEMVRLFNRTHDPDRIRLTFEKLLHTGDDRCRGGAMSAAGVRRDDQNFWDALLLRHSDVLMCFLCFLWLSSGWRLVLRRVLLSQLPCALSSSRARAS